MDVLDEFSNPVPEKKEEKKGVQGMQDQIPDEGARYIPMDWYFYAVLVIVGFFWMFPSRIVNSLYGFEDAIRDSVGATVTDWLLMGMHLLYVVFLVQFFRFRLSAKSVLMFSVVGAAILIWVNNTYFLYEGAAGLESPWLAVLFFGVAVYNYIALKKVEDKALYH